MHRADASLKVKDHRSCVLYDSSNGNIVSVYHSITYEGADAGPDQKEMESRAMILSKKLIEAATRSPMDVKNIKVLFASPNLFETPVPMKVDLKDLKVIPAES
jgi:hypothetical protein